MNASVAVIETIPVQIHRPAEQITDNTCPRCGGDFIDGRFVETGGGSAVQELSCDKCDLRWKNVYDFAAVYLIDEDLVVEIPREVKVVSEECSIEKCGDVCMCGSCSGQHESYKLGCDNCGCKAYKERQ